MKAIQFIKNIFIKNASGVVINPATNEKLDEVITAIEAWGWGGGGGNVWVLDSTDTRINPATAELQEMTVLMKAILWAIQFSRNADMTNNSDRVTVVNTVPVTMTSTTLTSWNLTSTHEQSVV